MAAEVIIRLGAMGDILLAVPAVHAISRPGTDVHWILSDKWKDLAPFLPANTHIIHGLAELFGLIVKLRSLKPSRIHDLQGKLLSRGISKLLQGEKTIYRKRPLRENFRAAAGLFPIRPKHSIPVWERYLKTTGVEDHSPDPSIVFPKNYLNESKKLVENFGLSPGNYFLVHPQASHDGKTIPEEALRKILAGLPYQKAVIGSKPMKITSPDALNLCGLIPLRDLPGIVKFARGLITTDSGPMHLARAVGTPLGAFFFQTDPCLGFQPVPGGRTVIFSRTLACKPCSLHGERNTCPMIRRESASGHRSADSNIGIWPCKDLNYEEAIENFTEIATGL